MNKPDFNFHINYNLVDNKHFITISPAIMGTNYAPKEIEITSEQWDALQYHFMKAVNDKTGETKLAYIG